MKVKTLSFLILLFVQSSISAGADFEMMARQIDIRDDFVEYRLADEVAKDSAGYFDMDGNDDLLQTLLQNMQVTPSDVRVTLEPRQTSPAVTFRRFKVQSDERRKASVRLRFKPLKQMWSSQF